MTTLAARVAGRGRLWAGFRCAEPVVVIESDDWGLRRRPCSAEVAAWGEPSDWADEAQETASDLRHLAAVLAAHVDPLGRPASFTANVIAANPDHAAIAADGFTTYHDRWLDETLAPDLLTAYREAVADGLLSLQLHGRAHADVERWLRDLREDVPGARALFEAGADGGLSLVRSDGWRYHSEYVDCTSGEARSSADLVAWLTPALDAVERLAGRRPRSAVAPHYVLTEAAEAAWIELGLEFAQAADYRLGPGGRRIGTSYLGERRPNGLLHLTRTMRFDPRPQRRGHHLTDAVARLHGCLAVGLPAVVDLHRINVTGPWAADALAELDGFLDAADRAGARYLTTPELGEAVRDGGRYRDVVHGDERHLTPVGRLPRAVARPLVGHR